MGEKIQVNFKVDEDVMNRFDEALEKFKAVTGLKPKRLECFEVALKDYIDKLENQAETLKTI